MLEDFLQDFANVEATLGPADSRYVIDGDRPAMFGHWRKSVGILDMMPSLHSSVVVMLGGRVGVRYRVDGRWSERNAAPGSAHFIPANRRIAWRINGELDMLTVQFTPSPRARALLDSDVLIGDLQFAVSDSLSLALGIAIVAEMERIRDPLSDSQLRVLADALCNHLEVKALRRFKAMSPSIGSRSYRRGRVCDHIEHNLERTIEVGEIARLLDVSQSYIFRFFKTEFGTTPHAYITRARINRACEMLQMTKIQLAELSVQIGFASQGHFSAVFKRHVGETPQQYRQRHTRAGGGAPRQDG